MKEVKFKGRKVLMMMMIVMMMRNSSSSSRSSKRRNAFLECRVQRVFHHDFLV